MYAYDDDLYRTIVVEPQQIHTAWVFEMVNTLVTLALGIVRAVPDHSAVYNTAANNKAEYGTRHYSVVR